MPLNISNITRARNTFHTDTFLTGESKVQFDDKGLIGPESSHLLIITV